MGSGAVAASEIERMLRARADEDTPAPEEPGA